MAGRRPLIAGNWKMNGLTRDGLALAAELALRMKRRRDRSFEMLICPPYTLISRVGEVISGSGLALGAQDCHADPNGPFTGDVAAAMLADLGCSHVIVGHSERRAGHGEGDAEVCAKAAAAAAAGLVAIVCVGESGAERDRGETLAVAGRQLAASVPDGATAATLVIAYEPVWAIGTGRTPTAAEVEDVHAMVRRELGVRLGGATAERIRILYGGSVKPANARELLTLDDVDGALVGGASLKADDFWAIAETCV